MFGVFLIFLKMDVFCVESVKEDYFVLTFLILIA